MGLRYIKDEKSAKLNLAREEFSHRSYQTNNCTRNYN